MSISISNLPEDISQEILLRLPVRYLLRFKSIDDYKLVRVERFEEFDRPVKESFEVEVYTLGTDLWRKIGNVSCKFEKHQPGVLVNGALHWFVISCVEQLKVLVSFDIANERFVEVPLPKERLTYPEEPLEDAKYEKHVAELGGCLCLVFHVFGVRVDVWVMQEYGVRESWTKSFTITEVQETITKTFNLRLKWSFGNNKILLQGDDKLILYDQKSDRYWKLAVCQTNSDAVKVKEEQEDSMELEENWKSFYQRL
ncbi:F-box/kelch-repeat protein At3g06240-like [Papaver somniferum]|uniref:F-box/kelch-repeat protein At3g06240-like n=1 Tax=Papaver somniferum TaxID=3469 RepID=UPI000E702F9C|nr:F-box/kelch-repeat protein At3g06240-like [Papaver somniferum]